MISGTTTNISATLTWTAPYDHGSAITGYKIEVQDFVTGNWLNLATVSTTTQHWATYSHTMMQP